MSRFTRRRFLAAGGAVAISSLGGCSSVLGRDEPEEQSDLLRLGEIRYANVDQSPHDLELVVSVDGAVVYWNTLELASVEEADSEHTNGTLDLSFPSEPVEYTVLGRFDGGETSQTSSSVGIEWSTASIPDAEPGCARVNVRIGESGELEVENWEAEQSRCAGG